MNAKKSKCTTLAHLLRRFGAIERLFLSKRLQQKQKCTLNEQSLANTPTANGSHSLGVDPTTIKFKRTPTNLAPRQLAQCHPFFFENRPITCTFFPARATHSLLALSGDFSRNSNVCHVCLLITSDLWAHVSM